MGEGVWPIRERKTPAEHQVSTVESISRHMVRWSQPVSLVNFFNFFFPILFSIVLNAVLIHLQLSLSASASAAPYEPSKGLEASSGGASDEGGGRREDGSAST